MQRTDSVVFSFELGLRSRNTPRFVDTGFVAAAHAEFVGLEAALVKGRFSAQAEFVQAYADEAESGATVRDLKANGFYVAASCFLTGEHRAVQPLQWWLWEDQAKQECLT